MMTAGKGKLLFQKLDAAPVGEQKIDNGQIRDRFGQHGPGLAERARHRQTDPEPVLECPQDQLDMPLFIFDQKNVQGIPTLDIHPPGRAPGCFRGGVA
jgi:hypothetical protein